MSPAAWIGNDSDDMHRVRPKSVLSQLPAKMRRAELVCSATGRLPGVVAIVYPQGVPLDRAEVLTARGGQAVGVDFAAPCRCGATHQVDGGRLRAALLGLRTRSNRVPRIDVLSVIRGVA